MQLDLSLQLDVTRTAVMESTVCAAIRALQQHGLPQQRDAEQWLLDFRRASYAGPPEWLLQRAIKGRGHRQVHPRRPRPAPRPMPQPAPSRPPCAHASPALTPASSPRRRRRHSFAAWGFCVDALRADGRLPADVALFSAQMLRHKLLSQAADLGADQLAMLKDKLLTALSVPPSSLPTPLAAQLCLCVCATAMLLPEWRGAVAEVRARLPPPTAVMLLELAADEAASDLRHMTPPSSAAAGERRYRADGAGGRAPPPRLRAPPGTRLLSPGRRCADPRPAASIRRGEDGGRDDVQ